MYLYLSEVLFFILSLCGFPWTRSELDIRSHPRIISNDGHLTFESGPDRNVTFRLRGSGSFNIGNFDLLGLVKRLQMQIAHESAGIYDQETVNSLNQQVRALTMELFGQNGVELRLQLLENSIVNFYPARATYAFQKLEFLEKRLNGVFLILKTDFCISNPCQNGGTCVNMYGRYVCTCPDNWQGQTCDVDVNECHRFVGTGLGCHNEGICVNTNGSFHCLCQAGWVGTFCNRKAGDCLTAPREICGHGVCVNTNNEPGYVCICEQGWKKNSLTPGCTTDIDECKESRTPCITSCINLPGSFKCAPCAEGFTGNGLRCDDIDECAINNGGCSTIPFVPCINTEGSYRCGVCPTGWIGDGKSCSIREDRNECGNNNICHPLASCEVVYNSITCLCPHGMEGYGIGPNGCTAVPKDPCNLNLCKNGGECVVDGATFRCVCSHSFQGRLCERRKSCEEFVCQNGGTCKLGMERLTCSCTNEYTGLHCETSKTRCTSRLENASGTLKYPFASDYGHATRCSWVIQTSKMKLLNVTFKAFNFEMSEVCKNDWLAIHNGPSTDAPLIGRFCGHELPNGGNIMSSSNTLYLSFTSDEQTAGSGFELVWESITPTCGGNVSDSHGAITSPGFPNNYPPDKDCTWTLVAPLGKRLQITFFILKMETTARCDSDYLAMYEGTNALGTPLEKYCNNTRPLDFTTPGNELTIHFHSGKNPAERGFQINFFVVNGPPGCGGTYTAPRSTFGAPMEDGAYMNNIICEYLILMPVGSKISIQFTDFHLEESQSCLSEFLEMFEGNSTEGFLVGKWCGRTLPAAYTTLSNTVFFKFKTNLAYGYGGFRVKYEIACGGEFGENYGVIKEPENLKEIFYEKICDYVITAPHGNVIELEFSEFDLGRDRSFNECQYNYLQIFDGIERTPSGTYCGTRVPPKFISTRNLLTVRLITESMHHREGFKANYSFVNYGCGGILRDRVGIIKSENNMFFRGRSRTERADCTWTIIVPEGYVINLIWSAFYVHREFSSCWDGYVTIQEDCNGTISTSERLCGSHIPPTMISCGNILSVRYRSPQYAPRDMFMANYRSLESRTMCGGKYFTSTGTIVPPGWPYRYDKNRVCVWIVTVDTGLQIELNVRNFTLDSPNPSTAGCIFDTFEIRNGGTEDSPLIGVYCGNTIPRRIVSLTNQLFMKFKSDGLVEFTGFYIEWNVASFGCGGLLTSLNGTIISPHYPQPYYENAECDWRIVGNKGSRIRIVVVDIELQDHKNCKYDYLEIYDSPTVSRRKLGRWCSHRDHQIILVTKTNEALVRMVTDRSQQSRGFKLIYSIECFNELTDFSGAIESPLFPHHYPKTIECEWIIKARENYKIFVTFSHFDVKPPYYTAKPGQCSFDWVQVVDVTANTSSMFCGSNHTDITSTGNSLKIKFKSNSSGIKHKGFHLEYEVFGCGKRLIEQSGEIAWPTEWNLQHKELTCTWIIEVNFGQAVELSVHTMDLSFSENCTIAGLLIASGVDKTNVVTILCGINKTDPIVVRSASHQMLLEVHANVLYNVKGFRATYRAVPAECGGKLTTHSGIIYSQHYPQNYERNSYCEWLIELDQGNNIELTLIDLDIEFDHKCAKDFLEIFDGPQHTNESRLFKGCGNELPRTRAWTSTSNQMLVTFHSNPTVEYKGFKLTYEQACSTVINATSPGRIRYPGRRSCQWTIVAPRLDEHVTFVTTLLTSNHLDVSDNDCSPTSYGVTFYDGDSTNGPIHGTYCHEHPLPIYSNGYALTIKVPKIEYFEGYYSTLDSACGGTVRSFHAKIASPRYPHSYPTNVECLWTVGGADGFYVEISISEIDIEESPHCHEDYLEIREGDGSGRLLGTFCGKHAPSILRAYKQAWIKFKSSGDNVGKGFLAEHVYASHNELSGKSGRIASPGYPDHNTRTDSFTWRLTVEAGNVIQMTIENVIDSLIIILLRIYDGFDETSPNIRIKRGTSTYTSSSNVVYISLHSGKIAIDWVALVKRDVIEQNQDCRNQLISVPFNLSSLASPGYPQGYSHDMKCSWILQPSVPGTRVALLINDLDMNDEHGCLSDYITVSASSTIDVWPVTKKRCTKDPTSAMLFAGEPFLHVNFVTSHSRNGTGFNSTLLLECRGQFTEPQGILNFTLYSSLFFSRKCIWTIVAHTSQTIHFDLKSDGNINSQSGSCTAYIIIRNGASEESPFLGSGHYCTTEVIPQTSSNHAYVEFVYEPGTVVNMSLNYKMISEECGEDITLTEEESSTIISTIKYPEKPKKPIKCVWIVRGPVGHRLKMMFLGEFEVGEFHKCDNEYFEVFNGATALSRQIGRFCFEHVDSIFTSDNLLRVRYVTKLDVPEHAFKAEISFLKCGGTYHSINGTITSNDYPILGMYPANSVCDYVIEQPVGSVMTLNLVDVHLPESNCSLEDNLAIYSTTDLGNDTELDLIIKICGTAPSQTFTFSSNKILIRLTTFKPKALYRGFKVSFRKSREECGGCVEAELGYLTSMGYPHGWSLPQFCTWYITVPKGRRVKLEIFDFDVATAGAVSVFNDFEKLSSVVYNDSRPPHVIYSTDNLMVVMLHAFESNRGVKLLFSSDEPTICNGTLNGNSGSIQAKLYNLSSTFCYYERTLEPAVTLAITHSDINLVHVGGTISRKRNCIRSLSIEDGNEAIYKPCYSLPATTLPLLNERIRINVYRSQEISEFTIDYKIYPCGGITHLSDHLTIVNPSLPDHNRSLDCAWLVKKPSENVKINLTGDLQMNWNNAVLKITSGYKWINYIYDRSQILPERIFNEDVFIEFHSDVYSVNSSFMINLQLLDECGGNIGPTLRPIHFNRGYKNNMECIWTIHTSNGFTITANFTGRFFIEDSQDCRKDYLQIRDKANNKWTEIGRICGRDVDRVFQSTGNEMQLIFRSDEETTGDGFTIEFEYSCGGTYYVEDGPHKIIQSPKYPIGSPPFIECIYTFIVPDNSPEKSIQIQFDNFTIEGSNPEHGCMYGNLTINKYDPVDKTYVSDGLYCGISSPPKINEILRTKLIFKSGPLSSRSLFKFSYGFEKCGGLLTNQTTFAFTAGDSSLESECFWRIQAPENRKILIEFEYVKLREERGCDSEFVQVFSGFTIDTWKRRAKLCGQLTDRPIAVNVEESKALVHLVTDGSSDHHSFVANLYFKRKCDSQITLNSSHSTQDYISLYSRYGPNLDCHISIIADEGSQIEITFREFYIALCTNSRNTECSCDYLEIRDGSGPFSELIGTYCGFKRPNDIMTSSNMAYLRFVSDSEGSNVGFIAEFRQLPSVCGQLEFSLNHNQSITIEFPNNVTYLRHTTCLWRIKTLNREVDLNFERMVLQDPDEHGFCTNDYLEIFTSDVNKALAEPFGPELIVGKTLKTNDDWYEFYMAQQQKYRFCGTNLPSDYYTNADYVFIKFKSNSDSQRTTFRLKVRPAAGCYRNYTSLTGRIVGSKSAMNCDFHITSPENYTLSLYIRVWQPNVTEVSCEEHTVEVHDLRQGELLKKRCGFLELSYEDSVFTNTNQIRLSVTTIVPYNVDITYLATNHGIGCGGELYSISGVVTSPMYPVSDGNFTDCRWNFHVPSDFKVGLIFTVFDMGSSETCEFNYMEIIDGDTEEVLRRYCASEKPAPYKGERHRLSVRYRKNIGFDGTGWVLQFAAVHQDTDMMNFVGT